MNTTLAALALTSAFTAPIWPTSDLATIRDQAIPTNTHQPDQPDQRDQTTTPEPELVQVATARTLSLTSDTQGQTPLPALALPGRRAIISAPLAETIEELLVAEGDIVERGQPLLRFDASIPAADLAAAEARARAQGAYLQARARLRFAEINEATMRAALSNKAAGEMEVLRATAEREQADAAHTAAVEQRDLARLEAEQLRAQLDRYTPTAPFAGLIARVHAQVGETPGGAQPLIEIVDLQTLRVEMHLPASNFSDLEIGAIYTLQAGSPVNQPVEATLTAASRVIDPASRTIRCLFVIDNQELNLPSGFHVTAAQPADVQSLIVAASPD